MSYRSILTWVGLILAMGSLGAVAHAGDEDTPGPAVAASDQDLEERVKKLEASMPSWLAHWVFKGDFRFRFEQIDKENSPERNRNRIRGRIFAGMEVNDEVDVGFQLATTTGNPVSTNLTLGNGFEGSAIRIDLAYVDWHPDTMNNDGCGLDVIGGKMKTPFDVMQKSELLWDPDLRPEGVAARFTHELSGFDVFANLGGFWVREGSGVDSGLWGAQVGAEVQLGAQTLTFGAGYYDYGNVEGEKVFYYKGDGSNSQGNSTTTDGTHLYYAQDFDQLEAFGELAFEAGGMPVAVFANAVENTAADKDDFGFLLGAKVGKVKEAGSWDARYQFKKIERDAVLAAFTDSDFGGGGTDAEGHELNFGYGISQGWSFGATFFSNDIGISGTDEDYQRVQLDLEFKR